MVIGILRKNVFNSAELGFSVVAQINNTFDVRLCSDSQAGYKNRCQ